MKLILVVVGLTICMARVANAQIQLKFGPESFSTPIEGTSVTFVGTGTLKLFTPAGQERMDVEINSSVDLSNLQQVIPGIVQAKGNKNDDCSEVIRLHTVDLRSSADVYVGAHYERWTCFIGKNKIFEQNGDVTIGLALAVRPGGKEIGVDTTIKKIDGDGVLGTIFKSSLVGPYLTDWLSAKILQAIDPSNLKGSFPAGLTAYNPTFRTAKFVDLGSNKLGVALTATFSLSQDQAQQLINNLKKP